MDGGSETGLFDPGADAGSLTLTAGNSIIVGQMRAVGTGDGGGGGLVTYTAGTTQKAYDGQCLKCHRDGAGAGIGLTH